MTRLDCGHPFSESLGLVDAMIHDEPISLVAPCDEPECNSTVLVSSRKAVSEARVFTDQADATEVVSDKCDSCSNCRCTSDTALGKIRSIHQSLEQECISNSVRVDKEQARTFISLPFIKDPVAHLKAKHNGKDSNLSQAIKIFQSQLRKPESVKERSNLVFQDFIQKKFICKFTDLPQDIQSQVMKSPFRHFMIWRTVFKEDSLTTPVRVVVDGTCSGINDILAKGENNIPMLVGIGLRSRLSRHVLLLTSRRCIIV